MTQSLAAPATAPAAPSQERAVRIPTADLLVYGAPAAGHGFMFLVTGIYLMNFATDVLGIAPATMALLFGATRIWDAVSDPVAGFLTDRTRTRFGRRRPWMLAGAFPMGLAFAMLWAPPEALGSTGLPVWTGIALLLFYTASTAVEVPYSALGAELSGDYHERTRVFGYRRAMFGVGSIVVVVALQAFQTLDPRVAGRIVGGLAGAATVVLVLVAVWRLRERPEYLGRGARHPLAAARDVWANPHARLLLGVFLIQQLGLSSLIVALPYYAKYVVDTPGAVPLYMLSIMLAALVSVPFWMRLSPRGDKRRPVIAGMAVSAVMISLFSVAPVGNVAFIVVIAAVGGFASGCLDVILPSIQADVIDVDELRTGERKEGAYFAAWAFAAKTAGGLAAMAVGLVLAGLGFEPNVTQQPHVLTGMRIIAGIGPALLYTIGLLLFLRFTLGPAEHAEVRRALAEGARPPAPPPPLAPRPT